jgi:hypothetical protein
MPDSLQKRLNGIEQKAIAAMDGDFQLRNQVAMRRILSDPLLYRRVKILAEVKDADEGKRSPIDFDAVHRELATFTCEHLKRCTPAQVEQHRLGLEAEARTTNEYAAELARVCLEAFERTIQ